MLLQVVNTDMPVVPAETLKSLTLIVVMLKA